MRYTGKVHIFEEFIAKGSKRTDVICISNGSLLGESLECEGAIIIESYFVNGGTFTCALPINNLKSAL